MKPSPSQATGWLIVSLALFCSLAGAAEPLPIKGTPAAAVPQVFFDDFTYDSTDALASGGWNVRTEAGHPGIAGAQWGKEAFRVVADPQNPANKLLRMEARTDGSSAGSRQAQICHARKYLEGTFAARVRFSDEPIQGPDGDVVIQSFYLVSPLRFAFDPEFSEVDWEYLPNGGWGDTRTRLYGITWQTVQIEPWKAYNQAHEEFRPLGGWHTLVMQIGNGKTRHYLDGKLLAEHGGRNYPVVPMSLNFNLWFSPGGELPVESALRVYQQDVDWVYHVKDQLQTPEEVARAVAQLRNKATPSVDTVPALATPLPNQCNF
ncbi:MAG: glycoside hydrolase family 16 protein [Rhodoferax sp.]|nr:glycoside hydrolase family 16 protein [Rhodoferax sp.]